MQEHAVDIQEDNAEGTFGFSDIQIINLNLLQTPALQEFAEFYLSKKHLLSKKRVIAQLAVVLTLAFSGSSVYIPPALKYAIEHWKWYAGNSAALRAFNYAFGTTTPALGVLIMALLLYLTNRHDTSIPPELKKYFDTQPALQKCLRDVGIWSAAFISAIPLTFLSFAYPLPIPVHALYVAAQIIVPIIIQIDNTALHVLPIELALQSRRYRLLVVGDVLLSPLEWLAKKIYKISRLEFLANKFYKVSYLELLTNKLYKIWHKTPNQTVATMLDANEKRIAEDSRNSLLNYLAHAQKKILLRPIFVGKKLAYQSWNLTPFKLAQPTLSINTQHNVVPILLQYFPVAQQPLSKNPFWFYDTVSNIIGACGANLIWCGCTGYMKITLDQLNSWLHNTLASAIITAPANYFYSVLMTFFGDNIAKDWLYYLTHWGKYEPKLPLEFKLFPITFTVITLFALYIVLYSSAAAEQLIFDGFQDAFLQNKTGDIIRAILIKCAELAIPVVSFYALLDTAKVLLRQWIIYYGNDNDEAKIAATLMTTLGQLMTAVKIAKPELFLPHRAAELRENIQIISSDSEAPPPVQQTYGQWLRKKCCFWRNATEQEAEPESVTVVVKNEHSPLLEPK